MTKVLIVEDEEMIAEMYKIVFEDYGYSADIAADGIEGIEKAHNIKPDIILMDIMMPKMNGLDALQTLKADPETSTIPIIMLSNLTDTARETQAIQSGAIKYIIKSEHIPSEVVKLVQDTIRNI